MPFPLNIPLIGEESRESDHRQRNVIDIHYMPYNCSVVLNKAKVNIVEKEKNIVMFTVLHTNGS